LIIFFTNPTNIIKLRAEISTYGDMSKSKTIFITIIYLFLIFTYTPSSIAAQENDLRFVIKLDSKLWLMKYLESLGKEMEQTAKIYKTTDQKAYWESEAKKSFSKLLRSKGYYAHTIDVEIPDKTNNHSIIFNIVAGQRYKISALSIVLTDTSNKDVNVLAIDKIGIKIGDYVIAKNVLDAEKKVIEHLENKNCILSLSVNHEAEIDHVNKDVKIRFLIEAGPSTKLEKVEFVGLKTVKAEYVRKLVKLLDDRCLKRRYIYESRGFLQKSGLFSSTTPIIPEYVNKDGSVPIGFNLTERKARSLKAGIGYETDLGLGAALGWEHRNLFGSGEELKTDLLGNQREQILGLDYSKPFFKRDDQTLRLGTKFENRKLKTFASKEASMFGYLERELSQEWSGGVGTKFSNAVVKRIEQNITSKRRYSLISSPLFVIYDTRDNILDAKKGRLLELETAPYFYMDSKEKPFLKTQISASTYFNIKTKLQPVIAIRAATGTIVGTKPRSIPETERFYVGGNNSLRGYAYQFASNLDSNNRPTGGQSFVEMTIELRLKMNDDIGIVSFLDNGYAYNSVTPDLKKKLLHGAGLGVRYLTNFGPLRFDIGFPLKRRKFVDKSYQLYFGIGQSF